MVGWLIDADMFDGYRDQLNIPDVVTAVSAAEKPFGKTGNAKSTSSAGHVVFDHANHAAWSLALVYHVAKHLLTQCAKSTKFATP
jgi:hypothetical protein